MNKSEKVLQIIKDRNETIRIQGILKKRTETLTDFIKQFFTEWNNEKDTIFTATTGYNVNKGTHTERGRRRSLGDIYLICKYYYPNVSIQEVAKLLYFDIYNNKTFKIRSSICSTIQRRVFYLGGTAQTMEFYNKNQKDEFGFTYEDWETIVKEPIPEVKVVVVKKPVVKKKVAVVKKAVAKKKAK